MQLKAKEKSYAGLVTIVVLICLMIFFNCVLSAYDNTISGMLATSSKNEDWNPLTTYNEGYPLAVQVEQEGAVLLKNDKNVLLLAKKTGVTVLGAMSYNYVQGGTGSAGGMDDYNTIELDEALSYVGLKVNKTAWKWLESTCGGSRGKASTADKISASDWTGHSKICEFSAATYAAAKESIVVSGYTDYAIVTFGRSGAEGASLTLDMDGDGSSLTGRHYQELSVNEEALLAFCAENFEHTIVLINSANQMELGFINDKNYNIDACIWIGHPGEAGLDGVANLIVGNATPSGKLVDTYAYDMSTTPAYYNINDNRYTNAGSQTYYQYEEGIYVGYRYYETAGAAGYFDSSAFTSYNGFKGYIGSEHEGDGKASYSGYDEVVQFPFGYGLSYTTFDKVITASDVSLSVHGSNSVSVKVTNTGSKYSGAEVVELYMEAPYNQDPSLGISGRGLEKSKVVLVGFAKTGVLAPGESQEVTISFDTDELASFDNFGKGCYVLEKGKYNFNIQSDSHQWGESGSANQYSDRVSANVVSTYVYDKENDGARRGTLADEEVAKNSMDDVTAGDGNMVDGYLSRSDFASGMTQIMQHQSDCRTEVASENLASALAVTGSGSYQYMYSTYISGVKVTKTVTRYGDGSSQSPVMTTTPDGSSVNDPKYATEFGKTWYYNPETGEVADSKVTSAYHVLSVSDLAGVDFDDPLWNYLMEELTLDDAIYVQGTSGKRGADIPSIGREFVSSSDGPGEAGNANVTDAIWWPCAVIQAATWNEDLIYDVGVSYGHQAISGGIGRAYAPAMNIHRSPFGGRDFEYYSEDGFLSGVIGNAEAAGIQSTGTMVTIKHFALNDNDTNRGGVCTWANEQAIREIYAKPFEMCVKSYDTKNSTYYRESAERNSYNILGIMASLCRIGMSYEHYGFYTQMLRNEWNFKGALTTDGDGADSDAYNNCSYWMYGASGAMLSADLRVDSAVCQGLFGDAAYNTTYGKYLLKQIAKYNAYQYANATPASSQRNTTWKIAWIALDVVLVAGIVCAYIFGVHRQITLPAIEGLKERKSKEAKDDDDE